jgi:hypothetical protein
LPIGHISVTALDFPSIQCRQGLGTRVVDPLRAPVYPMAHRIEVGAMSSRLESFLAFARGVSLRLVYSSEPDR